jgi:dCMP deaminase
MNKPILMNDPVFNIQRFLEESTKNGDQTPENLAKGKKEQTENKKDSYYRPTFDDYFMSIAKIVATRSTCDRLRAGAVLVKNKRIMATGYNGAPAGMPHCDGEDGHKMENGHCIRTLHAEENAILQVAYIGGGSTDGSTMYTTYSPCYHCAKKIISSGIKRVVCGEIYRDGSIIPELVNAGVLAELYPGPHESWKTMLQGILGL